MFAGFIAVLMFAGLNEALVYVGFIVKGCARYLLLINGKKV